MSWRGISGLPSHEVMMPSIDQVAFSATSLA